MLTIHQLTRGTESYPTLLEQGSGPPKALWYAGDVSVCSAPCISVIGSRQISPYGRQVIRTLIPPLVRMGLTIVSGLAYGVDGEAHRVALEMKGKCCAVLGSGLHQIYPEVHQELAENIVGSGGCIFSEYEPLAKPEKYTFPERNRIIAALSPVTLVIEAGERSGTLITARHALDAGREVMVVPGDIFNNGSFGVHQLLKQGAHAITSPEDILEYYRLATPPEMIESLKPALTGSPATLYTLISRGYNTLDRLQSESGLVISELYSILTVLEMDGYIHTSGSTWQKT
jgi:DNA processing protein